MLGIMSSFRESVFVALCLGMAFAASAAPVTLSDSSPGSSGNWAPVDDGAGGLYVLNSGNSYVWYSAGTGDQLLITGFPWSGAAGVVWGVGSEYTPTTINPATEGAISSIDMSISSTKGSYDGVDVAFLIIQNGNYYRTNFFNQPPGTSTPTQTFSSSGLTASSFGNFIGKEYGYSDPNSISGQDDGAANFAMNPNFTASGAPITLGYLADFDSSLGYSGDTGLPAAYQETSAWSATVNFVSVPEPASIGLMCSAGLLGLRRRGGAK